MKILADIWSLVNQSVSKYLWHQQLFNLALVNNKGILVNYIGIYHMIKISMSNSQTSYY